MPSALCPGSSALCLVPCIWMRKLIPTPMVGYAPAVPLLFAILASVLCVGVAELGHPSDLGEPAPDIEVFVSKRCPHCTAAKLFLTQLQRERPGLTLLIRDVDEDPAGLARLKSLSSQHGYRTAGVPAFHLRGHLVIGFAGPETTGSSRGLPGKASGPSCWPTVTPWWRTSRSRWEVPTQGRAPTNCWRPLWARVPR